MDSLNLFPHNGSPIANLENTHLSRWFDFSHYLNRSIQIVRNGEFYGPANHFATNHLGQLSVIQLTAILLVTSLILSSILRQSPKVTNAPYHGYRAWFEPTFLVQARFIFGAKKIISSGYQKFKGKPFVVRRWDTDITVLPEQHVRELRLLPATKLSGVKAQVKNLVHKYTYTTLMVESNLHFRVLQNKLTPELGRYLDVAKTELEYGWPRDLPQHNEWTEVDIQQSTRMSVARMSAKIFLGHPACRNDEWLDLTIGFSIDLFATAFTLRMFPPWMHPFVAPLHPGRWRIKRRLKKAQEIIGPLMNKHRDVLKANANGEKSEEDDTLLNWMMDNGNEKENLLFEMSNRQSILSLASIHTTSMAVTNMLFDLCAHPEWFSVLREEIEDIEEELGKLGTREEIGAKQWLPRLEKMDSFFVESQRFNPPILLVPQRLAIVPITLKDGTHIPKGARLAWANADILDESASPEFDPMRSYRKRRETGELNKHGAGQPDQTNLHFGYGNQACPGRFFAIGEIKLLMTKLLTEFEFKFKEGQRRPRTFYADENVFVDPTATLLMRKREIPATIVD